MRTCHQCYSIGAPRLLRLPVRLRRLRFVNSFHDFMFATSTTDRFRFLKDLRILEAQNSSLPLAENHASQLKIMRILSHSTHLEKVSLWDVEGLLDNFPDAISQLVNLSMLREIECSNSRSLVGWLGQLRAPLTELSFSLDDNDPPVRFLGNISHFRDTLRTLSVGYPFFDAIDAGTQFPHVGKLTIQFIYPSTPSSCYSASTIFRLFPNLKSLVFPADSYDSDDLESFQTEIEGWHDEHVVEAVRDGVEGKALEEFNGCVDDLYAGAYICRIQRLFVHCLDHINSQWLLPLLIHIRPSILILEFWRCESGPATIGILSSILQELSTCNSLQSLFLVYSFEGTESGVARSIMVKSIRRLDVIWL